MKIRLLGLIFVLFSVVLVVSLDDSFYESDNLTSLNLLNLVEGKNLVNFNFNHSFYVQNLIKLNPEIQVISYTENGKSVGYVNFLNGLGKNFIIEDREYEIIVSKNISLIIP